jgi:hypothetical protein
MYLQDMGHIYDRRWRQTYESSVFHWDRAVAGGKLDCEAEVPQGTKLTLSIRAAANKRDVANRSWQSVPSGEFSLKPTDRCLQYRATFTSDNGDRYPILDWVRIDLQN